MAKFDEVVNDAVKELVKHCKTQEDFTELFKQLKQRGLEAALSGELTDHLGYDKNQRSDQRKSNSRNGYAIKRYKPVKVKWKYQCPEIGKAISNRKLSRNIKPALMA